ncbi:glycosyltransferase family protein [Afifella pfennigii]|uniref:hypothetical protein n=1 Tax=Afifella pfennigii TaxID=209897 RepID=UPI00047EE953|nr:hypothetical protein [Afifella pfennigii]
MLSAVIAQPEEAQHLARSLAALVPAAIEGMVREALVVGDRPSAEMQAVAEEAGAEFIACARMEAALKTARGDWLLLMEGGARPVEGWIGEVREFLALSEGGAARFTPAGSRLQRLSAMFDRPRALRRGLLIRREEAVLAARGASCLEALARGRAARRIAARMEPPA